MCSERLTLKAGCQTLEWGVQRAETMKQGLLKGAVRVSGAVTVAVFAAWVVLAQPSFRRNHASEVRADPARLREHVEALSQRFHPRDWQHPEHLDQCADYIAGHLGRAGAAVEFQSFAAAGRRYRNVIGRFGAAGRPVIVVGAHYDTFGELPGADDNASGIAVLLEVACLLGKNATTNAIELVAYSLEEPPFFRTDQMGSAHHAKRLVAEKTAVEGVIVLEMVGCFSDAADTQSYPVPLLRLLYPGRANFVAAVGRWDQGAWIGRVKAGMKGATDLPVYSLRAPSALPGIDFSDQVNYWQQGFKAVMVTDTAFYRNKAYHTAGDTAATLDYRCMAKVVVAVFEAVRAR